MSGGVLNVIAKDRLLIADKILDTTSILTDFRARYVGPWILKTIIVPHSVNLERAPLRGKGKGKGKGEEKASHSTSQPAHSQAPAASQFPKSEDVIMGSNISKDKKDEKDKKEKNKYRQAKDPTTGTKKKAN